MDIKVSKASGNDVTLVVTPQANQTITIDRNIKGDTGATGSAATIAVGTTTTGAAGSNASVTNSGTSSNAVFNFAIPQGAKGDTGATGATGAKGDKGDTGAGVAAGGTTGQVLAKASATNYDTTWVTSAGMVYPAQGIPNSTGSSWGTSYGVTGTGSVVLSDSPTITTLATITGSLQLTGLNTANQNIATTQTTGSLTVGGTGATGAITLGQSTGAQTVNIATAVGSAILNLGGGGLSTGTISLGRSTGTYTLNIASGRTASAQTNTVNIAVPTAAANGSSVLNLQTTPYGTSTICNIGAAGTQVNIKGNSYITGDVIEIDSGASDVKINTVGYGFGTIIGNVGDAQNLTVNHDSITLNGTINTTIKQQAYTVAGLPAGVAGARCFVTNALAPTFGAAVAGGGAVGVPVYHDGTSWKVG
jgi:hypothetical protein